MVSKHMKRVDLFGDQGWRVHLCFPTEAWEKRKGGHLPGGFSFFITCDGICSRGTSLKRGDNRGFFKNTKT